MTPSIPAQDMHRILLVDDEAGVLAALQRLLRATALCVGGRQLPLTLDAFTSPRAALDAAAHRRYDLALCDYRMPELDGVALLTRLRELQPDCARVVLSGYTDLNGLVGAINQARIDRFVAKPWNDFELVATLAQVLEIRALRMQNDALAEQVRGERGELTPRELELRRLERMEPGLTRVQWGPDGSVLMDPQGPLPDTGFGAP